MKKIITILFLAIWGVKSSADEIRLNCEFKEIISQENFVVIDGKKSGNQSATLVKDFFLSITPEGCAPESGKRWGEVQLTEKWIQCEFLNEFKNFAF